MYSEKIELQWNEIAMDLHESLIRSTNMLLQNYKRKKILKKPTKLHTIFQVGHNSVVLILVLF